MDKKFLLEHNLMKAHDQFMSLCNEGYISTNLEEADDDQQAPQDGGQQPPMGDPNGGMPPAGPDAGAQPPMGGDPNQGGDAPMPPADGAQGQEPPMDGGMPPADGNEPPMDAPAPDMPPMEGNEPQEKDDVLDIDELTKAQEKLNKKENMVGQDLGKLDSRIENLLSAVEKMQGVIDHNNEEITSLKAELQKRVPTQTERLEMQSLHGYPFNVNPDDYWKEKEGEGVYDTQYNNGQPKTKEYVIKNQDVDDYSDSDIENSLEDMHQSMKDIFKNW